MTEIILHIGTPKTGTTAIQNALSANETALNDEGIAFLRAGRHRAAHNDLANAISRHGADHRFKDAFEAEFAAEIASDDTRKILITSEIFTLIAPRKFKKALPQLADHPLKIVVYLRRQDQYAEAFYKQRFKNGRIAVAFNEFLEGRVGRRITDYNGLLSGWADMFPNAQLEPRIYDRRKFPDGDITADFATTLGIDPAQLVSSEPERNVSPSRDVIDILLALTPHLDGPELRSVFRAVKSENLEGFSGSGDLFSPDERQAYVARFADKNAALRDAYFPNEQELFRAPKVQAVAQQDAGLSDVQRSLLDALLRAAFQLKQGKS